MLIAVNTVMAQYSPSNKNETISKSTSESIFVHLSNTTLITGETLHCKFYCLNPVNNHLSSISKIAHVELIDDENKIIFINKIYLDNGTGQGDFFIPTTIKSGNYKLISYTNWMQNKIDSKISEIDLVIINPYINGKNPNNIKDSKTAATNTPVAETEIKVENPAQDKTFSLELNKKITEKREQILLKVKPLKEVNNEGSFSVSIKRIDNLPSQKQMSSDEFVKSNSKYRNQINDNILFLPELRGEIISGTITNNKDSKEIADKNIALSIPGKDFAFKIVKTDQNGKFNFILDKNPNNSGAVIQVAETNRNDFKIEIDKNNGYNLSEIKSKKELNLTSDYKNAIEERSVANQIENAYYSIKKDSVQKSSRNEPFYHPLEKDYVLSDYTKFPSLKETITEVVKEVYYREDNNDFTLNVRDINYDLKFFSEPALVMVDGLLIQNVKELIDYKMDNVYKISLVPGVYVYGPKAFNGIINFTTKNNDYISKENGAYILKTQIERPLNQTVYFNQDYTDRTKYDRIPDYRYQLLWEPELSLNGSEKTISFYTSDVSGTYEINLEGFTKDGTPVSLKETFEVKDSNLN
ncbi:hypothetical protein J2Y38_001238 [Flavobacterium sp. 2755]|uniref:hypothetical protein n=1 Tax=Flavobacterium sp. 2755 TaxID=2817765 RepID=UPI00285AC897|nr:hypothetical protein [Flavobacterium sp. 2755]MDR6761040.1 hypothetical protein [Flavobacterium sp. 2755]